MYIYDFHVDFNLCHIIRCEGKLIEEPLLFHFVYVSAQIFKVMSFCNIQKPELTRRDWNILFSFYLEFVSFLR